MKEKINNAQINVDQWGNCHIFAVSRAVIKTGGVSITTQNTFSIPYPPIPYFYIMPSSIEGELKVRLLDAPLDEYVTLSNDVISSNLGSFLPLRCVEVHSDTTLTQFIIGV